MHIFVNTVPITIKTMLLMVMIRKAKPIGLQKCITCHFIIGNMCLMGKGHYLRTATSTITQFFLRCPLQYFSMPKTGDF